jgi:hypothetical protein
VLYQLSYIPTGLKGQRGGLYVPGLAPVKAMTTGFRGATAALMIVACLAALARAAEAAGRASSPLLVAESRCNDQTINESATQIRDYDRHGAGDDPSKLQRRFGKIADVLTLLAEERGILDRVCSSDAQKSPLFAQIGATAAWALSLESDAAAKLNASCPAAAKGLSTMMLSDAWLSLANVVNDGGGTVPTDVAQVASKVQTRAAAIGLTLPTWANTSAYWRDQLHEQAKQQIATCAQPSPAPTVPPSPAPASTPSSNPSP